LVSTNCLFQFNNCNYFGFFDLGVNNLSRYQSVFLLLLFSESDVYPLCVLAGPEHRGQRILIWVTVSFSPCAVLGINIFVCVSTVQWFCTCRWYATTPCLGVSCPCLDLLLNL